MDWLLFGTILAQVGIGSIVFMILCFPVGLGISWLVHSVVRVLPRDVDEEAIADEVLDRIMVIGKNTDG